jgi:hypothetical protein
MSLYLLQSLSSPGRPFMAYYSMSQEASTGAIGSICISNCLSSELLKGEKVLSLPSSQIG